MLMHVGTNHGHQSEEGDDEVDHILAGQQTLTLYLKVGVYYGSSGEVNMARNYISEVPPPVVVWKAEALTWPLV